MRWKHAVLEIRTAKGPVWLEKLDRRGKGERALAGPLPVSPGEGGCEHGRGIIMLAAELNTDSHGGPWGTT